MADKSTISGRDTYVLDPDEISQLDELSLTSVMRQVDDPQPKRDETAIEQTATVSGDTTINELLSDPEPITRPQFSLSLPREAPQDLIDSEVLFPEEPADD